MNINILLIAVSAIFVTGAANATPKPRPEHWPVGCFNHNTGEVACYHPMGMAPPPRPKDLTATEYAPMSSVHPKKRPEQ